MRKRLLGRKKVGLNSKQGGRFVLGEGAGSIIVFVFVLGEAASSIYVGGLWGG